MFTLQGVSCVRKTLMIVLGMVLLVGLSTTAQASIVSLPPGGTISSPDVFATCCGTLLASASQTVNNGSGLNFTVNSAVFADPSNMACAGCLDFVFQVSNSASSTDSIYRLTASNFGTFTAFPGYLSSGGSLGAPFVNGNAAPLSIDRSVAGNIIGFGFFSNVSVLPPGSTSKVLVIETNATNFANGTVNIFGSAGLSNPVGSFQPAAAPTVPEPGSLSLLGIGLAGGIGLFAFIRARRGRQA